MVQSVNRAITRENREPLHQSIMDKRFVNDDGVFVSVRMVHGRWFIGQDMSPDAAESKLINQIRVYETETALLAEQQLKARQAAARKEVIDSVIAVVLMFAIGFMVWIMTSV